MATVVSMSASRVIFGEFDSQKRYMRANVAGANLPIVQGITFWIAEVNPGAVTNWRYSVAGYTMAFGSGISNNASYTLVTV